MRSTDLQAYIGLSQIDKLDDWGKKRKHNYNLYQELIKNDYWKPKSYPGSLTSNFAYPIISPNRDEIVKSLQENQIEVRPMICGSMGTQPFYVKKFGELKLPKVSIIDECGFYVPNHPSLIEEEIKFISNIVNNGL
jgi:CDP-6-deoxy-D-xylo-4-hexulose-3-dehydrase